MGGYEVFESSLLESSVPRGGLGNKEADDARYGSGFWWSTQVGLVENEWVWKFCTVMIRFIFWRERLKNGTVRRKEIVWVWGWLRMQTSRGNEARWMEFSKGIAPARRCAD